MFWSIAFFWFCRSIVLVVSIHLSLEYGNQLTVVIARTVGSKLRLWNLCLLVVRYGSFFCWLLFVCQSCSHSFFLRNSSLFCWIFCQICIFSRLLSSVFCILHCFLLHFDGSRLGSRNGFQFCLTLASSVLRKSSQWINECRGSLWSLSFSGCISSGRAVNLVFHNIEVFALDSMNRIYSIFFLAGDACAFTLLRSTIC